MEWCGLAAWGEASQSEGRGKGRAVAGCSEMAGTRQWSEEGDRGVKENSLEVAGLGCGVAEG